MQLSCLKSCFNFFYIKSLKPLILAVQCRDSGGDVPTLSVWTPAQ